MCAVYISRHPRLCDARLYANTCTFTRVSPHRDHSRFFLGAAQTVAVPRYIESDFVLSTP